MSNDYSELYAKALEFIDNEDFENGIAKLEQIVNSDPTQHEA